MQACLTPYCAQAHSQPQAVQLHIIIQHPGAAAAAGAQQQHRARQHGKALAVQQARKGLRITALEEEVWGQGARCVQHCCTGMLR